MTSCDAKTAEFALLYDFFERLASRRTRSSSLDTPMDDLQSLPIPEELEPVIKSLSAIVGTSKAARKSSADSDVKDEESFAKFPLGKKYPFTFKLMVHKLYRVDEWAKKVKEMLEKSKMEFKPLAEQAAVIEQDKVEEEQDDVASVDTDKNTIHFKVGVSGGWRGSIIGRQRSQSVVLGPKTGPASPLLRSPSSRGQGEFRDLKKICVGRRRSMSGPVSGDKNTVHFKAGVNSGSGRRGSVVGGRQRSQTVVIWGPKIAGPASPLLRPPGVEEQSESRVLKKRCIGRRKSMSAMNGDSLTGRIGSSWVYDAAISLAEHPASTMFPGPPSATPPFPSTQAGFLNYQAVGASRKVSIGRNMKRRVSGGMPRTLTPLLLPFHPVTNVNPADRILARKRALTVDGVRGVEEMQMKQMKQMKRPFAH